MSDKKRPTLDQPDNTSAEKRVRSDSNISHSSWIHRLTTSPESDDSSNGIWSWLGYAGPTPNDEVTLSNDEAILSNDEATLSNNGATLSNNEAALLNDELAIDDYRPQKSFYWKSLFASNNNTADSVIISNDKEPQQETIIRVDQPTHNMVLPTFESQYQTVTNSNTQENTNLFSKAINAINSIFTQKPTKSIDSDWQDINLLNMIDLMKSDPENVAGKKIVIIGVHGWFPMKLVRSVLGEPTGTSNKFCEQMTLAVKKYFHQRHDLEIPDKAIINIPLQWEGKVTERVDKLYDYLISDWKQTIESADVILWVTHSQGTPVSAILLKKLIEENLIHVTKQPVCMLAMAGISHGPFPTLKQNLLVKYFEADAARELFDFMDSKSDISIQYREAMSFILQNKIKTVLVGSMQDQVVPLYSAIMSGISHPNILRAIYIDGHIYTRDDFLIRLITFALRLLNVGLSDHGFLIHISEVLAGNIYSWEGGHSTIYEEPQVFILALQYMFETLPFGNHKVMTFHQQEKDKIKQNVLDKVQARLDPFQAKLRLNPFHLPWAMRGIWDDPRILNDDNLSHELDELQNLFDEWNPTSSRLKEIKFRLEPLKARL